jgi:hypothetical protein
MFYLLISLCPLWLCVRHFGQVIGKPAARGGTVAVGSSSGQ